MLPETIETTEATNTAVSETVPLPEATDADIQAFLDSGETQETEFAESEQETTEPAPATPTEQQPAQQAEGEKRPAEDSVTVSTAEWKKIHKRLEQQEIFIQHRSTELGQTRKQLAEANKQLGEQIRELDSPVDVLRTQQQIDKNEETLKKIDSEEKEMTYRHQAQKVIANALHPEEADITGMAEMLKQDGIPENIVAVFAQDPYKAAHPDTIVQLGKRQKLQKDFLRLAAYTKKLLDENQSLKSKPGQVLKTVQTALKQVPQMTAASGGGAASRPTDHVIDDAAISGMTDAEIDALLQT